MLFFVSNSNSLFVHQVYYTFTFVELLCLLSCYSKWKSFHECIQFWNRIKTTLLNVPLLWQSWAMNFTQILFIVITNIKNFLRREVLVRKWRWCRLTMIWLRLHKIVMKQNIKKLKRNTFRKIDRGHFPKNWNILSTLSFQGL